MPTFNDNLLPNTTGLNLGASNQQWDSFIRSLTVSTLISNSVNPSQSGMVRLASADTATIRNFSNTQDLNLFSKNVSDVLKLGDSAGISTVGPASLGGNTSVTGTLSATGALSAASASITGALSVGQISSSGYISALNVQSQQTQLTGTGADQNMFTFSIPANTLVSGRAIRVSGFVSHNSGSANVTYKLLWGNQTLAYATTTNITTIYLQALITRGLTGAPTQQVVTTSWSATSGSTILTGTQDPTLAITTGFSFNVANTDTVVPQQFIVELLA